MSQWIEYLIIKKIIQGQVAEQWCKRFRVQTNRNPISRFGETPVGPLVRLALLVRVVQMIVP